MSDDVKALQQALAGEHATIWAYGAIGAHASDDHLGAVGAADNAHRAQRGALEELIRSLGQEPEPSKPGYTLPSPVTDDATAVALAATLEDAMGTHWRYCCGRVSSAPIRTFCVDALITSTTAALQWRRLAGDAAAVAPALPGLS